MQYYTCMTLFIIGLVLSALALIFWVLYRTYEHVPAKEMKRLARRGDEVAALLYKPVAYGMSLRLLLGLLILICTLGALNLFVVALGTWLASVLLIVVGSVGWLVLVPTGELTHSSLWLAKHAAPAIAWLLERLHPLFNFVAVTLHRHRPVRTHTGLYEKSDLAELLEKQKNQPDNRIAYDDLELLSHSLDFGDLMVSDALVPKRAVKLVAAGEAVGPVLMADLHASGHRQFPVYEGKRDHIVGVLYLHDLVAAKQTGEVEEVMKKRLSYVHEDFTLYQTLQAFLKTKQHLFLVVNSFEELVGMITIEDILRKMVGKLPADEFDRYEDPAAVAAATAKKDPEEVEEPEPAAEPPEPTAEPPEVI